MQTQNINPIACRHGDRHVRVIDNRAPALAARSAVESVREHLRAGIDDRVSRNRGRDDRGMDPKRAVVERQWAVEAHLAAVEEDVGACAELADRRRQVCHRHRRGGPARHPVAAETRPVEQLDGLRERGLDIGE